MSIQVSIPVGTRSFLVQPNSGTLSWQLVEESSPTFRMSSSLNVALDLTSDICSSRFVNVRIHVF